MKDYDAIAKLQEAIEYSGNKWSEWGERAEHVGELLDEALAILRKHDEAEAGGESDLAKCTVQLLLPTDADPFRRESCNIIDRSYSENGITIECPALADEMRPAPTDEKALREAAQAVVVYFKKYGRPAWGAKELQALEVALLGLEAPKDESKEGGR